MCTVSRSSRLRARDIVERLGDEQIQVLREGGVKEHPSALAVEDGFIPVGRGAELPSEELILRDDQPSGPCAAVLRDVAIAPSGKVLPCCSVAGLTRSAEVGNARETRLRELIEAAGRRPVFRVLREEGPQGLHKLLDVKTRSRYVSRCHMCYEALRGLCSGSLL